MTVYTAEGAKAFIKQAFLAAGAAETKAAVMADTLVYASLRGVDSHGISRTGAYLKRVETGIVDKDAEPRIVAESSAGALLDAGNTFGQYASVKAVELVCEKAAAAGVAMVAVANSNHFGSAGYYVQKIAERGMIGVCGANSTKAMVLWGAAKPFLGTNPLAYAVPAGKYDPLILDMATSVVARGKIRRALDSGTSIPPDWAVGPDGKRTTDPAEAYKGYVLPFGGPKGSAIALFVEILSGVITGAAVGPEVGSMYSDFDKPQGLGHFFIAVDPARFIGREAFAARMESLVESVKALPASEPGGQVFLPGEIERGNEKKRRAEGIPVPPDVEKSLAAVAQKYGLALPENVGV